MAITEVRENRYLELDALRGVAAMLVVLFHLNMANADTEPIFKYGVTGVDLFFIISGFVIFMSINQVSSGREFVINRFARLYPTYWVCVTITCIVIVLSQSIYYHEDFTFGIFRQYLANMTMFQYYLNSPNLDQSYWTLIVEMLFYIVILSLYELKTLKRIEGIGLSIVIGIFLLDTFTQHSLPRLYSILFDGFPLLRHFPLFFSGILFYKIYTDGMHKWRRYLMLAFCLFVETRLYHIEGSTRYYITQREYLYVLMVYYGLFVSFVNGWLGFLVNKATLFLGNISYTLYVLHGYIATRIVIPGLTRVLHINFYITAVITLAGFLFIAGFITNHLEIPMRKRIKSALRKLATSSA